MFISCRTCTDVCYTLSRILHGLYKGLLEWNGDESIKSSVKFHPFQCAWVSINMYHITPGSTSAVRSKDVAMWRSWLRRQSGNPEIVGLSPAGGEKLAVGLTFSGQKYKRFSNSGHVFTPPRWLNWVPEIRWACIVDDSTLSAYNTQQLGLYIPEWRLRLRKSIYEQWHRPAGVFMCEALWVFYME